MDVVGFIGYCDYEIDWGMFSVCLDCVYMRWKMGLFVLLDVRLGLELRG